METIEIKWNAPRKCVNPFVPNASENIFFYSLKSYGFLMFSGDRERVHWEQMGSTTVSNMDAFNPYLKKPKYSSLILLNTIN